MAFIPYSPILDLSLFASTDWQNNDWHNGPERYIEPMDRPRIQAQVVVQEEGSDDLDITQHPVSQGAAIHDHAYKRPAELSVRMGWTTAYAGDLRAIYAQILQLQATRTPFSVATGKRLYRNMLIASLRTMTDARFEFTFMADISFREVVLVNTSIIMTGSLYDSANLIEPETHMATRNNGGAQALPYNIDWSEDQINDYLRSNNVPRLTPIVV